MDSSMQQLVTTLGLPRLARPLVAVADFRRPQHARVIGRVAGGDSSTDVATAGVQVLIVVDLLVA